MKSIESMGCFKPKPLSDEELEEFVAYATKFYAGEYTAVIVDPGDVDQNELDLDKGE